MTIPKAERDLLIFFASSRVCPEAPVFPTFSEPARSTKYRLPVFCAPVSVFRCWIVIRNIEWERDDSAFISGKYKCIWVNLRDNTYLSMLLPLQHHRSSWSHILPSHCWHSSPIDSWHRRLWIFLHEPEDCRFGLRKKLDWRKTTVNFTHVQVSRGFFLDKSPYMILSRGIRDGDRFRRLTERFVQ